MKLITEVEAGKWHSELNSGDGILLLGSCFTTEIGTRLAADKFGVTINPLGTLYNPISIAGTISLLYRYTTEPDKVQGEIESSLFTGNGLWGSWMASTLLSDRNREVCLSNVINAVRSGAQRLKDARALILTFGSNHVYIKENDGRIVANCHKMPGKYFRDEELSVEKIIDAYRQLLPPILESLPAMQIIMTVSPYRYLKYGLHDSELGKAVLLLAEDGIIKSFGGRCAYFPSFEIMNDELRSYRFYAPDMLHPTAQAADIIYSRFCDFAFSPRMHQFANEWRKVSGTLGHRPSCPEAEDYLRLMENMKQKARQLKEEYPHIEIDSEISNIDKILHYEI